MPIYYTILMHVISFCESVSSYSTTGRKHTGQLYKKKTWISCRTQKQSMRHSLGGKGSVGLVGSEVVVRSVITAWWSEVGKEELPAHYRMGLSSSALCPGKVWTPLSFHSEVFLSRWSVMVEGWPAIVTCPTFRPCARCCVPADTPMLYFLLHNCVFFSCGLASRVRNRLFKSRRCLWWHMAQGH